MIEIIMQWICGCVRYALYYDDILVHGTEYHRFDFPSQDAMNGRQFAIIRGKAGNAPSAPTRWVARARRFLSVIRSICTQWDVTRAFLHDRSRRSASFKTTGSLPPTPILRILIKSWIFAPRAFLHAYYEIHNAYIYFLF